MFGIEGGGNGWVIGLYGFTQAHRASATLHTAPQQYPSPEVITHPYNGSYQTIAPPPLMFYSLKFPTHQISDAQNLSMVSAHNIILRKRMKRGRVGG